MEIFVGFSIESRPSPYRRRKGPTEKTGMRRFGDFKLGLGLWILGLWVRNSAILGLADYEIKQTEKVASVGKER